MKATQQKQFSPVTITLETQQEVDGLFAMLIHIALGHAVGMPEAWRSLDGMESPAHNELFLKINQLCDPRCK